MSGIIAFFRASPPKAGAAFDEHRFRRVRWQTFIAMTLAYVTFYVCRLSFTVAKSALVELGITPTELGMIGSTLFLATPSANWSMVLSPITPTWCAI